MSLKHRLALSALSVSVVALFALSLPITHAQVATSSGPGHSVSDAPRLSQLAPPQSPAPQSAPLPDAAPPPPAAPSGTPPPASPQTGSAPAAGPPLTRAQAEQMAIRQNPNIRIGQLLALADHQVVREARSAELPQLAGSVTAQQAEEGSRVASGSLSASRLFTRAGGSIVFSQLLTDFGRTGNLVASSKFREMAQRSNAQATLEDIVVATDQAFYNTLQAQAVLEVARQTVAARQTTQNQVTQLTKNNLRSTLDQSFAEVQLSQAQLLLLDAQNNADAALASLNEVLGLDKAVPFKLVDDTAQTPPPPPDEASLEVTALRTRPDLAALNYSQQSAIRFSRAQQDQKLPSINALGTVGGTPVRDGRYYVSSWDGAIGANISIPIFNGFLYRSEAKEAEYRAQATGEQARALRDRIVRDVHTSWLDANNAFRRIGVTAQLLRQANLGLKLAQTRYQLGLSSIVELSQAQLQQTQAAITNTNAEYQYRLALANLNYQTGIAP